MNWDAFLAEYWPVIALVGLYLVLKTSKSFETSKSDAKGVALDLLVASIGGGKKQAIETAISALKLSPLAVAKSAIEVLQEKLSKVEDRSIPDVVSMVGKDGKPVDPDGLISATNKAIASEKKVEKVRSGAKKVGLTLLEILKRAI